MDFLHDILNWELDFIDVLLLAILCFLIATFNYVRKTRWHYFKYKNVPLEIASNFYHQISTLHHSIESTIRDQALSIWDAKFRMRDLEHIKKTKKILDEYLKFSDDLKEFYVYTDEYIEFLSIFIEQHKNHVRYPQFALPIKCDPKSIHYRMARQFEYLENELLPVSSMPKSYYTDDKT